MTQHPTELRVTSLTCYSSFGNISVEAAGQKLSIDVTPAESQELMALALSIFTRRQQQLAEAIARARPLQLSPPAAPEPLEGDWTEVPTDGSDNTSF